MSDKSLTVWNASEAKMMSRLRSYVTQMQGQCPTDPIGRPTVLVNPHAILATGFTKPVEDLIDHPPIGAMMQVSYLEGLPTVDGLPIWEKLENEPIEYYQLFKRYRSMKDAKTQRAVYKLALESGMEARQLEILRQTYHWNVRVEAYDTYLAQEREVQLELRRQEIEGKHANTAEKLYKLSSQYIEEHPELLTPKLALQMLDMAIKLERTSVGAHPEGVRASQIPQGPSVTIQNNLQAPQATANTLVTGNADEDKDRLMQVLNIMNKIGLIKEEDEDDNIIEVDSDIVSP